MCLLHRVSVLPNVGLNLLGGKCLSLHKIITQLKSRTARDLGLYKTAHLTLMERLKTHAAKGKPHTHVFHLIRKYGGKG